MKKNTSRLFKNTLSIYPTNKYYLLSYLCKDHNVSQVEN